MFKMQKTKDNGSILKAVWEKRNLIAYWGTMIKITSNIQSEKQSNLQDNVLASLKMLKKKKK